MQAGEQDREDEGLRPLSLEGVERGGGPRLVLVHSSGIGAVQWSVVQVRLEQRYRSLAVNLSGYGGSPAGNFEDDVAGLAALLDGDTTLCGHSYGSFVAMHAARRVRPARLVVIEPVCFDILRQVGDEQGVARLRLLEDNVAFWDEDNASTEAWLRSFTEYWNGSGAWETMSQRRRRRQARLAPKVFGEVVRTWRDETPLQAWRELGCPVEIAVGEHTTLAARRVAVVLSEALGVSLHRVAGAGHMFPLTHPDAVVELLTSGG